MLWLKHPDALKPNLALLSYLALAYPLAWYGLSFPAGFAPSLLLMVNVLVLSAYLLHDCLHNNVFASAAGNERLGTALTWLVGAVYSPYTMLRDKHFRHHIERADILAVNYRNVLIQHPLLDRGVRWGSWLFLPAVDLLLQGLDVLAPWHLPQRRHLRTRNLFILGIRTSLLCAVFYLSPLAALGYVIAYLLFLWVMGFMDAFQHSYDIHYRLPDPQQKPTRDRHYEEGNTYSNLLSSRFPWINLLVLNFCYHNVHHQKPREPWYRLPALHDKCYPHGCQQLVPLPEQLAKFRRYRIERIHHADPEKFIGADGVSFLVGV
jgi:omega-6 fatty acid desaturase (delta-12 desaturase)